MEIINIDKYFIQIESMYTQGVGGFHMISSDKSNIEILRMELLKNIKYVEYTVECGFGYLCGWVFYENIYRVIDIKQIVDEDYKYYKYTLAPILNCEYEPDKCKVKNLKKVNWDKKIKKKDFITYEYKFMEEDYVYNTINMEYEIMNINNFNILGDQIVHKKLNK